MDNTELDSYTTLEHLQVLLIDAIHRADRSEANRIIDAWAESHGYERLFMDVLEPALLTIGDEWRLNETVTVAQAYIAGKIAEDVLLKIVRQTPPCPDSTPKKGPVVFGNIEDDFHSMGRKMVVTFLRINGWEIIDLGNDVPPALFVDTALETGARIIGVSAMTLTTAHNITNLRNEIDSRGLAGKIQLAVGGAVFLVYPELVQQVGGDDTATNAITAVSMVERLWKRSTGSGDAT